MSTFDEYVDQQPDDSKRSERRRAPRSRRDKGDRLPPHSVEAEQGVIGCCLSDPEDALGMALEFLGRTEAFYDLRHQLVFQTLTRMYDEKVPLDLISLNEVMTKAGTLEQAGGLTYIASCQDKVPSAANLSYYLEIVREKCLLRKMIYACTSFVGKAYDYEGTVEELMGEFDSDVVAVGEAFVKSSEVRFGELIPKVQDRMEEFARGKRMMQGLETGFNYLDNMLCGLKPEEFVIIAARPSAGKTSLGMGIPEWLAVDKNIPVGVFSMEMSNLSLVERQLFSRARANYQKYRNGFLLVEDVAKLTDSMRRFKNAPLFLDDASGLTPRELKIKGRRMIRKHGVKLLVIDYLQLMRGDKKRYANRQEEMADISAGVKQAARDLKLPIIALAQMNREIEKDGNRSRKPQLSDLRESGNIEQDADVVMFLYDVNLKKVEDDLEAKEMKWLKELEVLAEWKGLNWRKFLRRMNLLVAKQRNGPTGDVALVYLKWFMRFVDAYTPPGEDESGGVEAEREPFETDETNWPKGKPPEES